VEFRNVGTYKLDVQVWDWEDKARNLVGLHTTYSDSGEPAAGWMTGYQAAKHVYAINVGRDAKRWRKKMVAKPYPKPRPELSGRSRSNTL
jgi:hypothetical protein